MSGLNINLEHGPKGYVAEELITGGQVVAPGANGGVKVAAADAEVVLGVALVDAGPTDVTVEDITIARPRRTSVAYGGVEVKLEYTGMLAFGDTVGVAEGGKVKKHAAGAKVGIVTAVPTTTHALVRLY
ncbi:hypothetical protein [Ancrocorticia populi]|uniref:hypothetical protein n=1 Tax=Ancrocorticia populi TaxID=2175228 RepID=UPI003F94DC3B